MQYTLRPYQISTVDFMLRYRKIILANDMGTGKTLCSLVFREKINAKKTLIICPKVSLLVWGNECEKFFDWKYTIYTGTPKQRANIYKDWNTDILITNFAQAEEVLRLNIKFDLIVIDEYHLAGLINHRSKFYKTIKKYKSDNMVLISGTPIRRNIADLYGPLSIINSKRFHSYWNFVDKYCIVKDNFFGTEIDPQPKNPQELESMLKFHMIWYKKEDILLDLPTKIRSAFPVEMDSIQQKAYKELKKDMMLFLDDEVIVTPSCLVQLLRLRQLLVCPRILGLESDGAAITSLVKELIPNDFAESRSIIIATPFKTAIPHLIKAIGKNIKDISIYQIHGNMKENAGDIAKAFNDNPSHRKVLILTIQSGASLTLNSASITYFLGCSYSNIDNMQVEARIHRIGQTRGVDIRYLLHKNTIDNNIIRILNSKRAAEHWVLNPQELIKSKLF